MLEKIEALRQRPKHVRNRYAFWSAALLTFVIASVWVTTLPARFSSSDLAELTSDEPGRIESFLSEVRELISDTQMNAAVNDSENSALEDEESVGSLKEAIERMGTSTLQ